MKQNNLDELREKLQHLNAESESWAELEEKLVQLFSRHLEQETKTAFNKNFEELLLKQEMYDLTHILSIVLYLRLFQDTNATEATMTVDSLNREGVDLGKLTLKATFEPKVTTNKSKEK